MPSLDIPANTWTTVVTTTEQTAVQAVGGKNVFVTTEDPSDKTPDDGLAIGPMFIPVFGSGKTISAYSVGGSARVVYMGLGVY
jgi:hypothetical protein